MGQWSFKDLTGGRLEVGFKDGRLSVTPDFVFHVLHGAAFLLLISVNQRFEIQFWKIKATLYTRVI
jgi:hypothetical protein